MEDQNDKEIETKSRKRRLRNHFHFAPKRPALNMPGPMAMTSPATIPAPVNSRLSGGLFAPTLLRNPYRARAETRLSSRVLYVGGESGMTTVDGSLSAVA